MFEGARRPRDAMTMLSRFSLLAALFIVSNQARAEILIGCGGYSTELNDHVEWDLKIVGSDADRAGEHFKVSETKNFFVFSGRQSRIRINKTTKRYVTFGSNRALLEWSRKVPGEGCDISESSPNRPATKVRK